MSVGGSIPSLATTPHHKLIVGVTAYGAAALLTLVVARAFAGAAPDLAIPVLVVLVGCVVPVALARWRASSFLAIAFAVVAVAALALVWRAALPDRPYGDGRSLATFLTNAYVLPRWLLGMALAVALYIGVWQFPPVAAHLPAQVATPGAFAALLCALSMGTASVAILMRWPRRLSVVFAMLTPIWMLFASGYVEYYPLMIGPWLAKLAWTFEQPLSTRQPVAVGVIVGILPAVYIGFVGFSVALAVVYAIARPRDVLIVVGAAAATLALAIAVSYPGIPWFLRQLYAGMNFGEAYTVFPRYVGRASSPSSIFFATRYVFARSHLRDIAYMVFWSAGWLLPVVLVGALIASVRLVQVRDARVWLGSILVGWQTFYLFWMIPKLGPTADVDLFCPTVVALAFVAGELVDRIASDRLRHALLCAVVGVAVATSVHLAWIILPTRT